MQSIQNLSQRNLADWYSPQPQLRTKKDLISQLDNGISETIKDEGELETELTDADSYLWELEEKIAVVAEFVREASQPPVMLERDPHALTSHPPSTTGTLATSVAGLYIDSMAVVIIAE